VFDQVFLGFYGWQQSGGEGTTKWSTKYKIKVGMGMTLWNHLMFTFMFSNVYWMHFTNLYII
jgi:hypothetical protein